VLSPDSGRCAAALGQAIAGSGEFKHPVYSKPQLHGFAFLSGLRGICKDLGLQYDLVDLVQTVAAILREPGLVDRWAAGEAVFRPAGRADHPGAGTSGQSAEAS
jgi:hypothetical protein